MALYHGDTAHTENLETAITAVHNKKAWVNIIQHTQKVKI